MNDPIFLFFGYGSEYTLGPLFDFMSEQGDRCIEIDMLTESLVVERLQDCVGKGIVFITSAHFLYDDQNFYFYRTERKVISVLHVISTIGPVLSVYYPHDYKDPIKIEEVAYLPLFDLLLWPFLTINDKYVDLVKSARVGWIKNVQRPDAGTVGVANPSGCVFFLGAYQYYLNIGYERVYDDYRELFEAGVAIKLPYWHENEPFEEFLRSRGVVVYPSGANSIEIMRANRVVITHALSSVCLEACHVGKSVIYMIDPRLDYLNPLEEFQGLGNIAYVYSPQAAALIMNGELPRNAEIMQRFDFEKARNSIWAEYKVKYAQ